MSGSHDKRILLMRDKFIENNFDLIRLLAALQVAFVHIVDIMKIETVSERSVAMQVLYMFPGVPIFFFISGFLISRSYENNSCLWEYFVNRTLRLYPGLIVCVAFSIIIVVLGGYFHGSGVTWFDLMLLFLAKTTVFQFYNPDFMRAYGDGVLNGSLWTITVEVQFYFMIPVVYFAVAHRPKYCTSNGALLVLLSIFFLINRLYAVLPDILDGSVVIKLVGVSFLPWFYIFLLGVLMQRNCESVYSLLSGRFHLVLPAYIIAAYMLSGMWNAFGNNINPLIVICLVLTIFSLAYSVPFLSRKVLRGNDISYGLYIYHMPIVNLMIFSGLSAKFEYGLLALGGTIVLAVISWKMIEYPALSFKRHPLLSRFEKS